METQATLDTDERDEALDALYDATVAVWFEAVKQIREDLEIDLALAL